LCHFVELKVVDRANNTEEVLDGRAESNSDVAMGRPVLQMWKDVLVQLARHTALRRTFLVDDEVMVLPSTSRQTKRAKPNVMTGD
jgi:hypothetical protein